MNENELQILLNTALRSKTKEETDNIIKGIQKAIFISNIAIDHKNLFKRLF